MTMDPQLFNDFQLESKNLISQMTVILESCEGDFSQVQRLEEYGLTVDRIMGGAKTLSLTVNNPQHLIHKLGDYSAICKMVGYKASQIRDNESFYEICVGLLLDATDAMQEIVEHLLDPQAKLQDFVSTTLIERVKWVNTKFGNQYRGTVGGKKESPDTPGGKMNQEEIDNLLKKLGLD
jgi:hypothetical protein